MKIKYKIHTNLNYKWEIYLYEIEIDLFYNFFSTVQFIKFKKHHRTHKIISQIENLMDSKMYTTSVMTRENVTSTVKSKAADMTNFINPQ